MQIHGRVAVTAHELYSYFTTNFEVVNQFNADMLAFLNGEKVFNEPVIANLRL